jgi:hypothetical protein
MSRDVLKHGVTTNVNVNGAVVSSNPKRNIRIAALNHVRGVTMGIELVGSPTGRIYKKVNGTYYYEETSNAMINQLETLRINQTRCRFHWGDTETGKDWGDDCDVRGRIGRSTGPIKIPILIYNRRSFGGVSILTHCIVKITATKGGRVIYQHPKYEEANHA